VTPRYDYVAVGHVTLDLIEDRPGGTVSQPGGGAFYSAVQAARLGLRTLILTQGRPDEIEALLAPHLDELDLQVIPAEHTTKLATSGIGASRAQRVLSWAGPIADRSPRPDTAILHFAPVARETPSVWDGRAEFLGITPQGLLRRWTSTERISLVALDPTLLPSHFDAAVIGEQELSRCQALLAAARSMGAPVAVTAGAQPTSVHMSAGDLAGSVMQAPVPATATVREDLGAGDVFAAAFFVSLAEGRSAHEAAAFGNAAAAMRVAGAGADAIGERSTIEAMRRESTHLG
jgi:sugar/nucleoside kinase (ribokinase family)